MTASEKVAYLKGLAEGLGVNDGTDQGKLMLAVIDVLDSLAADVEALEEHAESIEDSIDEISGDMEYLEDLCIGDYDCEEDDADNGDDSLPCSGCSGCGGGYDDEEDDADDIEYEVTCPKCGETITVYDEDLDFGSVRCPKCDAELEFDLSSDGVDIE